MGQNELFNVDFDNNGWILDQPSLTKCLYLCSHAQPNQGTMPGTGGTRGVRPGERPGDKEKGEGGSETEKLWENILYFLDLLGPLEDAPFLEASLGEWRWSFRK